LFKVNFVDTQRYARVQVREEIFSGRTEN